MRAARGLDARHLGLVVDLLGPDPVRPDARGVDHVVGGDPEALAALDLHALRRPSARPPSLHQPDHLRAVRAHGAEALGLAENGQDQAGVVGLAVVEQVGADGIERLERRDVLDGLLGGDRPVAVRRPESSR